MKSLEDHHHFKSELISLSDTVARYERYVVDLLLSSDLHDSNRENSIAWELKHHSGALQMARILARKRHLPIDICSVGMLLHDIYAIVFGTYRDHAHLGTPLAEQIISTIGGFDREDVSRILDIIYHHSDKHVWSSDPFQEFGKDADILDCFLYPNVFGYYLRHKRLYVFSQYLERAKRVWREMEMPEDPSFDLLKGYNTNWFDLEARCDWQFAKDVLVLLQKLSSSNMTEDLIPPALCMRLIGTDYVINANNENWSVFLDRLRIVCGNATNNSVASASNGDNPQSTGRLTLQEFMDFDQILFCGERNAAIAATETRYEVGTDATTVLTELGSGEVLLMIWPAIGAYEVLSGEQSKARLYDLGFSHFHSTCKEDSL